MKCEICNSKKAKRICYGTGKKVCSLCCGENRNIKKCNSFCDYMKEENAERFCTKGIELTEVGRGKVEKFSESLFMPNINECLKVIVKKFQINIKNPILITVNIEFCLEKNVVRDVNIEETYLKDKWKCVIDNKIPFLQIYTIGSGDIFNEKIECDGESIDLILENNHLDTWMPNTRVIDELVTDKEEMEKYNIFAGQNFCKFGYGKYFFGKNTTFFGNLKLNKDYKIKFDIEYNSINVLNEDVTLNLGLLFPYPMVEYKDYNINILKDYILSEKAETQLLLPFEEKFLFNNLIPISTNNILSSPQMVKHKLICSEKNFYYDTYAIFNHMFVLDIKEKTIINAIFSKLPIFTSIYDTFNNVYENKYSPVKVVIFNTHKEVRKYKITVEIQGLSYKKVKEVYVEPNSVFNEYIAPQLIDEKIDLITATCKKNVYVKVEEDEDIIYENSTECFVYPKEDFVKELKNDKNDWKIDCTSFLARWVTPNAKSVDNIISKATQNGSIVGGNTNNTFISEGDIKKIYDELKDIKYAPRHISFSEGDYHTQRISLPDTVVKYNSGNCIDLSILLASCFEAMDLKTYIVLIPKHAFVRVEFSKGNAVCIESTYINSHEYIEAVECATQKYNEYFVGGNPKEGAHIVDISLARKSKIFPMN